MSDDNPSMKPYIIHIKSIGAAHEGRLTVATAGEEIPFEIKRTFWTYHTPTSMTRGRHTHYKTEMVLFALAGTIEVKLEAKSGELFKYTLDDPTKGLYIPVLYWHTMSYTEGAVQLVLASTTYDESDYIRDYKVWKAL